MVSWQWAASERQQKLCAHCWQYTTCLRQIPGGYRAHYEVYCSFSLFSRKEHFCSSQEVWKLLNCSTLKALSHWGNTAETSTKHVSQQSGNMSAVGSVARQPCHIEETATQHERQRQCCLGVTAFGNGNLGNLCRTTRVAHFGGWANFFQQHGNIYIFQYR